jgi:serine protease Do
MQRDRAIATAAIQKPVLPVLLGMQALQLSSAERDALNIKHGVRAGEVLADGPAAAAGIRSGDIIVSFNRVAVESPRQFGRLVEESPREQALPVLVLRDNTVRFIALKVPRA